MVDAVETMAWANTVPWHGLGFKVSDNLTPEAMLKAAKLDWTVSKRPMFIGEWKEEKDGKRTAVLNGKLIQSKDTFQLVRDSDMAQLSTVGTGYKPVQNKKAFEFFKKYVEAGHMTMETAGSLHYGRYIWALAKLGKSFTLGGGDRIEGYLLLCSPHQHGKALMIQFTPIRVVCWNTLSTALGMSMTAKGKTLGKFRMPHSIEFDDDAMESAEQVLGIAKDQLGEFETIAAKLVKKKYKGEPEARQYFMEVLRLDPKQSLAEGERGKGQKMVDKFQAALTHAPGHQLATASGTYWGLFNAVTYVTDHQMGETRDIGLKNAWLGYTAGMKKRALDIALGLAS